MTTNDVSAPNPLAWIYNTTVRLLYDTAVDFAMKYIFST